MVSAINDWKLSRKMMMAFALIGAMIAGIGITGIIANNSLSNVATRHVTRGIGGAQALARIAAAVREHRIVAYALATAPDAGAIAENEENFDKTRTALKSAIGDYAQVAGEFMPRVDKLRSNVADLEAANTRALAARKTAGIPAALQIVEGEAMTTFRSTTADVEELIQLTTGRSHAADLAGQGTARTALLFTIAQLIVALGALFVVWRLLLSTVSVPLSEIASVTKTLAEGGKADVPHRSRKDELGQVANAVELFREAAISRADAEARSAKEQRVVTEALRGGLEALTNGDLTSDIAADFPPAYAELKTNFNNAIEALRSLIRGVSDSASSIRTGSGEIAHASEDLARRTEGNAASLEQTSASLVQIDGRLKATAVAAARTVERADQAISTVSGGRAIAVEAVQAMGRVSESAKGIDSVIEGLDKIAFQTRVLAMNAAVEAGRAGDAGRGFAVVADLVSALAMRAEEEAKRARDQLTVTQTDIGTAVEAVQKVDGALADISGDVGQVHQLLGTMATDNQAQSSAITQISTAISTMDQSTQQNAAMVEETSAAARNLTSEVSALTQQAALFNVGGARTPAPPAAPRRTEAPAAKPRPAASVPAASAKAYASPVKPLPAPAMAAADGDDWNAF